jgi:hypothetical protein
MQLFRIWLGVTEYLFRNEDLLDEVINTAIEENTFRSDDPEFTFAARVSGNLFLFLAVLEKKNLSIQSSANTILSCFFRLNSRVRSGFPRTPLFSPTYPHPGRVCCK